MERTKSRLLKKEQNKMAKQTVWFVVGAVVLLLGFIFVILPSFINLVNSYLSQNPFPSEETVLLQAPLVDAPPKATRDRTITLTGYSPTGAEVILVLNDTQSSTTTPDEERRFALEFNLNSGANVVAVFARDGTNESPTSREYSVVYDAEPPSLIIDSPEDKQEFDRKTMSITVTGLTDKGSQVTVNGRLASVDGDGVFRATLALSGGDTEITVISTDEAGNITEQKISVTRSE